MTPNGPSQPDTRRAAHRSQHLIYMPLQADEHLKHFSFCSDYKSSLGTSVFVLQYNGKMLIGGFFFFFFFNLPLKPPRKMPHGRGRKEQTKPEEGMAALSPLLSPGKYSKSGEGFNLGRCGHP